jgi:hypothetical protein
MAQAFEMDGEAKRACELSNEDPRVFDALSSAAILVGFLPSRAQRRFTGHVECARSTAPTATPFERLSHALKIQQPTVAQRPLKSCQENKKRKDIYEESREEEAW